MNSKKLMRLSHSEATEVIPLSEQALLGKNAPIFQTKKEQKLIDNPLLNIEIALRKCERVGVFRK